MNERMLEIAFQAEFINKRVSDDSYFIDDPELMNKLEKFAELLVRECAAQCWTVSELEHKGDVVYQCSKRIRNHFGVE